MNQPVIYNFPSHYRGDELKSFYIQLRYKSGDYLDLTGAKVRMQMRKKSINDLVYEFSSENDGDALLTVGASGRIDFPRILSWKITASTYDYDMEITHADGSVNTYMRGEWSVNQDITRKEGE